MDNNGCVYCRGEKDLIKDEYWEVAINKKNKSIEIVFDGDFETADTFINQDHCHKCGRNLKTGNEMVEIKPLKFPSWEEFKAVKIWESRTRLYTISMTRSIILETMDIGIAIHFLVPLSLIISVYDCVKSDTPQGYKQACEEIEKIRKEFIIKLAEGN